MFISINYSRVLCQECNTETIILPGEPFAGLKCECKPTTTKRRISANRKTSKAKNTSTSEKL